MGKNKKHNKNRANVKAQSAQKQGSSVTIETREKKEIDTSQEMDVEEVSSRTQSLNTSKESGDISATTESDNISFDENVEGEGGSNKLIQYNTHKEGRTLSPNKNCSNFSHKRRSEPWQTKVESDGKRKGVKNEYVTERRQNNRRDDSCRTYRDRSNLQEFEAYKKELYQHPKRNYERTIEIEQDLFLMPKEYSLGHCVAEDMNMGSGIAVRFRYQFKRVDELLNQRAKTGGLAVLKDDDRFIYYLVTKRLSTGKPTNQTLFASLQKLREHVIKNDVKKLALPRIGCGLDRLYWDDVKLMIEFIFERVNIEIKICNLQTEESPQLRHKNCRLTNVTYPIQDIEEGTIIIYLSSEDGFVSEEMKLLDEKFHFLEEFRCARKTKGNVIIFNKCENYMICGCIVKKTESDSVDFSSFQKCVSNIQKENRKYQFGYVGFQAMKDDDDSCFNSKIINILRNNLRDVEVYVCWLDDLQNELLATDRSRTSFEQGKDRRSLNLSSSGRDSWRNNSPSTSSRNNKTYDPKRDEQIRKPSEADWREEHDWTKSVKEQSNENSTGFKNVKGPRVKIILNDEDNNSGDNKSSRTENKSYAHYLPTTSAHKTRAYDSKRDDQNKKSVPSEADWFEEVTNFEDKKIGRIECTRTGNKSHDRWDDSDVEDDETPKSNEVERSLGMTNTKTMENVWQSDQQIDEDSFEDSQTQKKPKKNKDSSNDVCYADDHPQTQCGRDVWLCPSEDITVVTENTFDDKYNEDVSTHTAHSATQRSERGDWANPDCKPFQPRQKENATVREENPPRNKHNKDYWEAKSHGQSHYQRDVWTSVPPNMTVTIVLDDQLHSQKSKKDDRVDKDQSHAQKSKKGDRDNKEYSQRQYQRDVWTSASQNISVAENRKDSRHVSTNQSAQSSQSQKTENVLVSHEYELYQSKESIEIITVREREAYDLPERYSRACYVTEDMNLLSGVPFGFNFKNFIGELLSQQKKEGNIAVVKDGSDYVYCLIVKKSATSVAAHHVVFSAIEHMRNHAQKYHVKNIVVPKMDNQSEATFDWSEAKYMLEFLCRNRSIYIFLTFFEHVWECFTGFCDNTVQFFQVQQPNRLVHLKSGLHQMKKKSIIIYWASEDGYISDEMKSLDRKFEFIKYFEAVHKKMGNVIKYKQNEDHVLYGCIVKKIYNHPINFPALHQCLTKINECNKTEMLKVVGIQAVRDQDETINSRIINVMITVLQDITLNVCWPGDLKQKMPKI